MTLSPDEIAELRRACEAVPNAEEGCEGCARCGVLMHTPSDLEPTALCNTCAQSLVANLLPRLLDAYEAQAKAGRDDLETLKLVEARVRQLEHELAESTRRVMLDAVKIAQARRAALEECRAIAEALLCGSEECDDALRLVAARIRKLREGV